MMCTMSKFIVCVNESGDNYNCKYNRHERYHPNEQTWCTSWFGDFGKYILKIIKIIYFVLRLFVLLIIVPIFIHDHYRINELEKNIQQNCHFTPDNLINNTSSHHVSEYQYTHSSPTIGNKIKTSFSWSMPFSYINNPSRLQLYEEIKEQLVNLRSKREVVQKEKQKVTPSSIPLIKNPKKNHTNNNRKLKKNQKICCLQKLCKKKLDICRLRRKALSASADKLKVETTRLQQQQPQAVYIIPTAPNVDIRNPGLEYIGPWYISTNGDDYGFNNDFWYKGIRLDQHKTLIQFMENGLFLIYSQVYYHITPGPNEKPIPMGYKIYLLKNITELNSKNFQRPFPIAECVPSYPTTFYQSCFTQVVWYLNEGDQIYLEHFTKSLPMIEADSPGKTFVGIVKLSSDGGQR